MDSRIKRMTILCVSFMVLCVLGIVVVLNYYNENKVKESSVIIETQPETSEELSEDTLKAFLKDNTFFDKEPSKYEDSVDVDALSLQVTSVEKDLRIMVLNYLGDPVPGEEFYVQLDEGKEYKDLDKDGMIYIGNLKAGEHALSLKPIKGYTVPDGKLHVSVKDKVEYTVIDNISFMIKTEDEIDASIEDTEDKAAIKEADDTEVTLAKAGEGDVSFGIDVSKWNKEIDWEKVKASGVEYAIIRCGYRGSTTGSLVEDPYFKQNIDGAISAGIKVGLYFFTQAVTEVEAVEEASMVLSLLQDYTLSYPIFIDTEGAGGNGRADTLDKEMRTVVCEAFCKTVEKAGYKAGVYASKNWLLKNLETERLEKNAIWLAEYREQPTYEGVYHMWQYTSKGKIDGIEGRVDLNISYLGQNVDEEIGE